MSQVRLVLVIFVLFLAAGKAYAQCASNSFQVTLINRSSEDLYMRIDGGYCSSTKAWARNGRITETVTTGKHTFEAVQTCRSKEVFVKTTIDGACGDTWDWEIEDAD